MQRITPFLLAALAAGLPAVASAQSGLALKGGVSFGDVSNKGLLPGDLDGRRGFAGGLAFGSGRGLLGIGLEGLYAQRGITQSGVTGPSERELDYIDVPVYLRLMAPTPGLKPFAYAGPQVSFELKCKAGGADCPALDGNGEERKKTTFAGVIGAGVLIGGQRAFSLEARYIYGLDDLKIGTITSSDSYKTRSFLILAGYHF